MSKEIRKLPGLSQLHISIVGLGLMGGSLAMALQSKVAMLTAIDINLEVLDEARDLGIIQSGSSDFSTGVRTSDLIILATPVSSIIEFLLELPAIRPDGCAVIDLGSTKALVSRTMERLPNQFSAIGTHPMCGREQSGLSMASGDLYRDQTIVLCRNKRTTPEIERLTLSLIQAAGALPLFLNPYKHDAIVAATSHLPYAVSSILMNSVTAQARGNELYWKVSATGLRDTTRLAGSDPRMMLDILFSNREELLFQLRNYKLELTKLIAYLEDGDEQSVFSWMSQVFEDQRSYRSKRW